MNTNTQTLTRRVGMIVLRGLVAAAFFGVWSTRAGHAVAPAGRFTSGGMNNIRDTRTQLVWNGRSIVLTPSEASTYCAGQGAGWRLPTVKELLTLVDESRVSPAWDVATFGDGSDVGDLTFLTSTPFEPDPAVSTWTVTFGTGSPIPVRLFMFPAMSVRCVRS